MVAGTSGSRGGPTGWPTIPSAVLTGIGFDVMNKESRQHNRLLAMGYKVVRFKFNEVLEAKKFGQKLFQQVPELKSRCRDRLIL